MKNHHEKSVEPLRMLPRFDSQASFSKTYLSYENVDSYDTTNENRFLLSQTVSYPQLASSLLPKFHSNHRRFHYDENQSADALVKAKSETQLNIDEVQPTNDRPNRSDIKVLERAYDRHGKKCWPAVNTNIGKFDLEYAYEIVGDTLESYIRYRKLNQCQALSNFIEYRNQVYKREKIAQYAPPKTKTKMKEPPVRKFLDKPKKIIKLEEKQSPLLPTSPGTISQTTSSNIIPTSQTMITETPKKSSPTITKEAYIPIPSPELLRKSIPKKTTNNIKQMKTKQTPSPHVKGPSRPKTVKQSKTKNKKCVIL